MDPSREENGPGPVFFFWGAICRVPTFSGQFSRGEKTVSKLFKKMKNDILPVQFFKWFLGSNL